MSLINRNVFSANWNTLKALLCRCVDFSYRNVSSHSSKIYMQRPIGRFMQILLECELTLGYEKSPQRQSRAFIVSQLAANTFLLISNIPKLISISPQPIITAPNNLKYEEKCLFSHEKPENLKILVLEPFLRPKIWRALHFKRPQKIF